MKIAVLSGKGGTGKTFVSVNLANVANHATYIDCDVEEPNGRLFLTPTHTKETPIHTSLPVFDKDKCTGCRACVKFCHFNALVYIKDKPKIFPEICHSCGGCQLVCSTHAISEELRQVGMVETGIYNDIQVVTGVLNVGEASAIPVIAGALEHGFALADDMQSQITVVDCPPGSSCSAMESVTSCDYCILVVEPTAFGFHNFQMVYELMTLLGKPCGIVINKSDQEPLVVLHNYCDQHHIPILLEIPYNKEIARRTANGEIATQYDKQLHQHFLSLLEQLDCSRKSDEY